MTTLASLPTRSLMTSRRASANETRRSQKGGLVARGPEFNTDPTEMAIAVITGHGVHVHRRLTKDGPGVPRDRQTAISRANRPKTTPNRGAGQTLPRRPLTAVETSSQAQNRHLTNVDTKDAPDVVRIKLEISHIDIDQCEGETWIRTYRRKILMLYTIILRDEKDFLQRLNFRTFVVGLLSVKFVKIAVASITLHVDLHDTKNITQLEEFIVCLKFGDLINDVIVTEALLAELGASKLSFFVHVNPDDVARCKQKLVTGVTADVAVGVTGEMSAVISNCVSSRKPTETANTAETERTNFNSERGQGAQQTNHVHRASSAIHLLSSIYTSLINDVQHVMTRYSLFEADIDHFLMTLTLTKKPEVDKFRCLNDIINCYGYLRDREVISQNVRYDLIEEYLIIINNLRIMVENMKEKLIEIQRRHSDSRYTSYRYLCGILDTFGIITPYFSPDFIFPEADPNYERRLSIMNRPLYSNLVAYIPWLIRRIHEIRVDLENILN